MSYVTEETISRLEQAVSLVTLLCSLVVLIGFMLVTVLLAMLGPSNMETGLVQATASLNSGGIAALAFVVLIKGWLLDWVTQ